MSWIDTISPETATGALSELYKTIGAARGGVARVHQVQSLNPRAMQAHLDIYKAIVFQRSSLSRTHRERIAVVVSQTNGCQYCITHHAEALRQLGDSAAVVEALSAGQIPPEVSDPDRTLLEWAMASTRAPDESSEGDVQGLRAAGFDDRAILDAALTVGYFCFVNRIVLLLGVHVEPDYELTCTPQTAPPSP